MNRIILSLLLVGTCTFVFADSPITSTNFYEAFLHHKLVKEAKESGELTLAMAEFLSSTEKEDSVQLKMAVINALSWDIAGKKNAELYWSFLEKKYDYRTLPLDKLSGDELLSLSYLKIMDDYNYAKEPLRLASMALKMEPESYTYQMIRALIKAQDVFLNGVYPHGWCKVYELVDEVENNEKLERDFKPEATEIIFEYINYYEEYCEEAPKTEENKKMKKASSLDRKGLRPNKATIKTKPTKKSIDQ